MGNNRPKKTVGRPAKESARRSFSIALDLSDRFDEFCDKTGRNKTRIVELALEEYMNNHQHD